MFDWGKTDLKFYEEIRWKVYNRIAPKFNQVKNMTRWIYLPSFAAIRTAATAAAETVQKQYVPQILGVT